MKKIKVSIIIIFVISFFAGFSQTKQEINQLKKRGYFGVGFGFGVFNPKDVNDYMSDYWDSQTSGYVVVDEYGFPEIYLNFFLQLAGGTYLSENVEMKGLFEFGIAPKIISIHDTEVFTYIRYSPGAMCNIHFNSSGPNNFTLGAGLLYHNMKFEEWKASAIGPRIKLAYTIHNKSSILELFLSYDIVKGDTGESYVEELSYSGSLFGANFKL